MCELFIRIAERFADVYGKPIPNRLLRLGTDIGWKVTLNPTAETIEGIELFRAHVEWNGFPAGIIEPNGGVIAAGELANAETFLAWLQEEHEPKGVEKHAGAIT